MRTIYGLLAAMLLLPGRSSAQQATAPPDTTRLADTNPESKYALAEVQTVGGRVVHVYVRVGSVGIENGFEYFTSNPDVWPFPKPKYATVANQRYLKIRNDYYEPMPANLTRSGDIMALRVVEGPVELFMFSGGQNRVPVVGGIPMLGVVLGAPALIVNAIPNTIWYVRRNKEITRIERKDFAEAMAQYVRDNEELSAHIRKGDKGYEYADMFNIISGYNTFLAAGSTGAK